MYNKTVFCLVFFYVAILLAGADSENKYDLKKSIINFRHVVYLDEDLCLSPELIKELEVKSEIKILNRNFNLKTGSGFIITEDGYAVTNRHVIEYKDLISMKENIIYDFMSVLIEEFEQQFNPEEIDKIINDFQSMVEKGEYKFIAEIERKEFETQIVRIAPENSADLALVKVLSSEAFPALSLEHSGDVDNSLTGERIYSFGYPLSTSLEYLFNENVVTMNEGNISAIRSDDLGIQHNAAISPGNSGGPLINDKNRVVGVNTAYLEDGNSLYFAVASDRVIDFLCESGFENLVKWNRRIQASNSQINNLKINMLGEYESSSDLLIAAETGSKIFIDGHYIGKAPMYYTLIKAVTELKIESNSGSFEGRVRKLSSLRGTTELIPEGVLEELTASFSSSLADGIEVYGDGRFLGITPFSIKIPADQYYFSFKGEGLFLQDRLLSLNRDSDNQIEIEGRKAYELKIDNLNSTSDSVFGQNLDIVLGHAEGISNSILRFSSKSDVVTYSIDDTFYLPQGEWKLQIQGLPAYDGIDIDFIMEKDFILNLNESGAVGNLTIRNFDRKMDIFVDGQQIPEPEKTIFDLPLGVRHLYIWRNGKSPYERTVTIHSDNSSFISYKSPLSHGNKALLWGATGLAVSGAGLALAYVDTDPYAMRKTDNYDDYLGVKQNLSVLSSTLIIAGTLALVPIIIELVKDRKVKKQYRELLED